MIPIPRPWTSRLANQPVKSPTIKYQIRSCPFMAPPSLSKFVKSNSGPPIRDKAGKWFRRRRTRGLEPAEGKYRLGHFSCRRYKKCPGGGGLPGLENFPAKGHHPRRYKGASRPRCSSYG